VEDFLHDLRQLEGDSKFERLCQDLRRIFRRRETVVIFSQYTDTMDYLRDKLRTVYGSQVACYSGRGGEYWNGLTWLVTTKEHIKNQFRDGVVKILVCTEAASEGLNLQTCGVLINYDMPWNPMRVEQRIGRIDRIGQVHSEVWVSHFFYEGTVEARVYQRLSDRIAWFEDVVGELQPILARVGRIIEQVALSTREEREQRLEEALAGLRTEIEERQLAELNLDQYALDELEAAPEKKEPVTLADLEKTLVSSQALDQFFKPHPDIDGAYVLSFNGSENVITFRRDVFDQHPGSVRLMTYGEGLFATLLASVEEPEAATEGSVVRVAVEADGVQLCGYSAPRGGSVEPIADLEGLRATLDKGETVNPPDTGLARTMVERAAQALACKIHETERRRRDAAYRALHETARQVLVRAAYLELALAQQPELGEEIVAPAFSIEAIRRLGRHRYPFSGLLRLVPLQGLQLSPVAQEYLELAGASAEVLRGKFEAEKQRAGELLARLAGWNDAQPFDSGEFRSSVEALQALAPGQHAEGVDSPEE